MKKERKDLDEFLDEYAGFSNYQKLLCVCASVLSFGTSPLSQISVYASATPADFRYVVVIVDYSLNVIFRNVFRPYRNFIERFKTLRTEGTAS